MKLKTKIKKEIKETFDYNRKEMAIIMVVLIAVSFILGWNQSAEEIESIEFEVERCEEKMERMAKDYSKVIRGCGCGISNGKKVLMFE